MYPWILAIVTFILLIFYCSFLAYLGRGFSKLKPGSSTRRPTVTVIVPAHNEEKTLPNLLRCLSEQHYPTDLTEIILVDDRSGDRTSKIMQDFASVHPKVTAIRIDASVENIAPKKQAVASAIQSSTGEIILTTDADALPGPDWISEMIRAYDEGVGMVLGYAPYRTDGTFSTLFHRILALDYFAMGAIAAASTGMGYPMTCNGANLSYRREIFQKVGGFGKTAKWMSGDDDLFLHRVREKCSLRINFAISPGSAVFNDPPRNFREFVRQRIRFASKHLAYPTCVKAALTQVYAFNLCLCGLVVGTIFSLTYLPILLTALGVKAVCEVTFLVRGQRLLEKRNLLTLYPFAAIPHIFYVVIFPILGQFIRTRW